jgi:hypothetical protein
VSSARFPTKLARRNSAAILGLEEKVTAQASARGRLDARGHEPVIHIRPKTSNSNALNKRLPTDRTLLSSFHAVFKGESSMTAILPSPLPARRAPLAPNCLPAAEKPNLPQSPPPIPKPPAAANSRPSFFPTRPPTSHPEFQPKRSKREDWFVSPRKDPPTSSVQVARLRREPTESPKTTLNGRNQPLNGTTDSAFGAKQEKCETNAGRSTMPGRRKMRNEPRTFPMPGFEVHAARNYETNPRTFTESHNYAQLCTLA